MGAHFNAEILIFFLVASSFSGSETFQFLCVLEGSLPGLCALLPGDPKLLLGGVPVLPSSSICLDAAVAIAAGRYSGSSVGQREEDEGFSGHSSPGALGPWLLLFAGVQHPGKWPLNAGGLKQQSQGGH